MQGMKFIHVRPLITSLAGIVASHSGRQIKALGITVPPSIQKTVAILTCHIVRRSLVRSYWTS